MIKLLAAFFAFGATMCALTVALLLFPGTPLDLLWRFNPDAQQFFQSIGGLAVLFMLVVGIACGLAAFGLWRGSLWGIRLGMTILSAEIVGDLFNAFVRHDYRSLIGLPIGGGLIYYLATYPYEDINRSSNDS